MTASPETGAVPEFRRWVPIDGVTPKPQRHTLEASASECAAVADRLGLVRIARLTAALSLRRSGQRGSDRLFAVTGHVSAAVEQTCIVSGEPVAAMVTIAIAAGFADEPAVFTATPPRPSATRPSATRPSAAHSPAGRRDTGREPLSRREVVIDADADDPPEPLDSGGIDLGELAVQELAVALDPYPRHPDAGPAVSVGEASPVPGIGRPAGRPHPFAVLGTLKGGRDT